MNATRNEQAAIDSYLMNLRRCLGQLPTEEINDILREIRGHILERAEASGEMTDANIVAILKALGKPEDIAPLYHSEALVARARSSFSPVLIVQTVFRWATISIWGFVTFMAGLVGYSLGFGLLVTALLKPFFPDRVGLWIYDDNVQLGMQSSPAAGELLGWWIIPFGLLFGAVFLVLTTRLLRWALRFASRRLPHLSFSHTAKGLPLAV